jgi:hypothetical protein
MSLLSSAMALLLVSGLAAAAPTRGPGAKSADPRNAVGSSSVKGKALSGPSIMSTPGAVISNGTVTLGLYGEANLTYTDVGLRFNTTGNEAIAVGCYCEGWGVADTTSGATGYANLSTDGGSHNMTMVSFTSTASTATSVVRIGSTFEVTHNFHPSSHASLYEGTVTVKNISSAPVNAVYRRVMDWDVLPTPFAEYVTNQGTTDVIRDNNNGFNTANPLGYTTDYGATGAFTDVGAFDQGSMWDFNVGALAPGQSKHFNIYYGAASTEGNAYNALSSVGAQDYSLAEPSTPTGRTNGDPNTFIFGYKQGCMDGLGWVAPLSSMGAYSMSRMATLDIRFAYGNPGCTLDSSVTLIVRNDANPTIRYVAHVLNRDLAYDWTTGQYHVNFTPAIYGVPANTMIRADVYFGGVRVGYARINVTP